MHTVSTQYPKNQFDQSRDRPRAVDRRTVVCDARSLCIASSLSIRTTGTPGSSRSDQPRRTFPRCACSERWVQKPRHRNVTPIRRPPPVLAPRSSKRRTDGCQNRAVPAVSRHPATLGRWARGGKDAAPGCGIHADQPICRHTTRKRHACMGRRAVRRCRDASRWRHGESRRPACIRILARGDGCAAASVATRHMRPNANAGVPTRRRHGAPNEQIPLWCSESCDRKGKCCISCSCTGERCPRDGRSMTARTSVRGGRGAQPRPWPSRHHRRMK